MNKSQDKLESLFQQAAAMQSAAERADYLSQACSDPELRREVESLLTCHDRPDRIFTIEWIPAQSRQAEKNRSHSEAHLHYLHRVLDGKYRLERLLGQGGMGAVYLGTHLGTGRYVAVKLITPQFMRNSEFVERFKREARAAGRLRHPNIVDVTDFGVATVDGEAVAYLVMEYLDGCTLGDVLAEEKQLPLDWVVKILEQVCCAVQEAHQRGIIHRDLKPANIWIEPNSLGGHRVKVLDFGIAKLAEIDGTETPQELTVSGLEHNASKSDGDVSGPTGSERVSEAAAETAISIQQPTRYSSDSTAGSLTRIGSILGTPAYMSPEQCCGSTLDARSDVYSIGVVAYQMLCGTTPFTGDHAAILRAQQTAQPKPPRDLNATLPAPVSRIILSALEKNPSDRPQTAMALALALRANTENLGALYRRSFALYSEYFPQIITLSLATHVPVIVVTFMTAGLRVAEPWLDKGVQLTLGVLVGLLKIIAVFLTGSTIAGIIAILVTQLAVEPLKPPTLRAAFDILRRRWSPFLKTGLKVTWRILSGFVLFVVPGAVMLARYAFWAPVVLLEATDDKTTLQRARTLASRSWFTVALAVLFQIVAPMTLQWLIVRITGLAGSAEGSVKQNVYWEIISLGSILALPLVSIVMSLVYLKMRQLGGEEMDLLATQIQDAGARPRWEQRMRSRVDSGI